MARLDILIHPGCMSEQLARNLAEEIRDRFPNWHVDVRAAESRDTHTLGVVVLPAFVLEGRLSVTGVPAKDWLLRRLKEWERSGPNNTGAAWGTTS